MASQAESKTLADYLLQPSLGAVLVTLLKGIINHAEGKESVLAHTPICPVGNFEALE
jgi:hypothetical protein